MTILEMTMGSHPRIGSYLTLPTLWGESKDFHLATTLLCHPYGGMGKSVALHPCNKQWE